MAWRLRTRFPMSRMPPVSINRSKYGFGKKWLNRSIFIAQRSIEHARPKGSLPAALKPLSNASLTTASTAGHLPFQENRFLKRLSIAMALAILAASIHPDAVFDFFLE